MSYDPAEQMEILAAFTEMLRGPTEDGGRKREAGTKVPWTRDPGHLAALHRHLVRAEAGELFDEDSGCSPWDHVAWRALALSWQQKHGQAGEC